MASKPYLSITLAESNVNIAANTSQVTATLYFTDPQGATWNSAGFFSLTVNGSTKTFTVNITQSTAKRKIGSYTVTVKHNNDGSKTVSASAYSTVSDYWGKITTSASKALTKIPRATTPTVTGATFGEVASITLKPATSSFTHSLYWETDKTTRTEIGTGVQTSANWNIPLSLAGEFPTSKIGEVRLICETYSGATKIGTTTQGIKVAVPESLAVKIASIETDEAVANIKKLFAFSNTFIQNESKIGVRVTADKTKAHGGTVASVTTEVDGITYNTDAFTTETITGAGNLNIKVTLQDSRGFLTEQTKTVEALDYANPLIAFSIIQNGDSVVCSFNGKVTPLKDKNAKTLTVKYKKTTEEAYKQKSVTVTGYTFEKQETITGIDAEITYEFIAILSDSLHSSEAVQHTGIVCISRLAGGKGVRLFGEAEQVGFWVGNIDYTITDAEFSELMNTINGGA